MTGTQDREAEKAAREAAWWERWWEADFSWEGLAKKRWIGWSITDDGQCVETQSAPDGAKPATLQDYFRWDPATKRLLKDGDLERAGLLVCEETAQQPTFHILHLPQAYADGTPTFKSDLDAADWADLEAEIARLLSRSGPTDNAIGDDDCPAADHRTQLHGAVLRAFPRPPTPERQFSLHLAAQHAVFLAPADANGVQFGSPAILAQALFRSTADFSNVEFSGGHADFSFAQFSGGDAYFLSAEFSGGVANFWGAEFSGENADFLFAQFSGGHANFSRAEFSGGHANFSSAEFSGGVANFWGAKFSGGDANFLSAEFSGGVANFWGAEFSGGNANFRGAEFSGGNADFWDAEFSGGNADFSDAQFSDGDANFSFAQFSDGDANFRGAEFSGGDADFWGAEFSGGNANFLSAEFSGGNANFLSAEFSGGDANFRGAEFSGGDADFLSTTFSHGTSFAGARFLKTCEFGRSDQPGGGAPTPGAQFLGRLNVRGAYFEGRADFSRVRFPEKAEDRNSAFEGARFFEPLDLKGVERLPFSAFHGIRLDKGLLLDSHHPEPEQFEQALGDAEAAIERDDERDPEDTDHAPERSGADARYAALEAGCRALKEAMAADGDRKREQEFFSHELAARERRVRHRLHDLKARAKKKTWYRPTSWVSSKAFSVRTELLASRLYARLSGYGGSILRPLAAWAAFGMIVTIVLTALVAGFAMAGGAIGAGLCFGMDCGATLHPVVTDTLDALIRGALGPFRLLAGRGEPFAYLGDTAPVFRSLVGGIMLVHGLISSALIFLCLLALRRQFQIN